MGTGRGTLQFVVSSSVRSDILQVVSERPRPTDDVLDAVDASTSAVYNGLNEMEEHGLIATEEDVWRPTGSGQLLADVVEECGRYGQVLDDVGEYLETHDTSALPRDFRLRIGSLAGAELIEATETAPHRAVVEVANRLEAADTINAISPIYMESYDEAVPEGTAARVVLNERVAEWAVTEQEEELDSSGDLAVRVSDVNFALGVTGSELLLSLPLLDGGYDSKTEVVVETESARAWGTELFESVWEDAIPASEYDVEQGE